MFKILLQHLVFEKAINIFFDKIDANFPRNLNTYSSISIEIDKSDTDVPTFAKFYDVEIRDAINPKSVMVKYKAFRFYKNRTNWLLDDIDEVIVNNPVEAWYEVPKSFIKFKKEK